MTMDRVEAFRGGVQVAGVHDLAEAQLILGAGATALGFPLRLPEPREDLTEDEAAAVIAACPPVPRVLITYQGDPEAVAEPPQTSSWENALEYIEQNYEF